MNEILKLMYKNIKKNKGKPIVAVIFDDSYNVLAVESNFPRPVETTKYNSWFLNSIDYLGHAEWKAINEAKKNESFDVNAKYNIIITTSPCDKCFGKIEYLNSFNKIYYLFEKQNNANVKFKSEKRYIHFTREVCGDNDEEKEMRMIMDVMYKKWLHSDNVSKIRRRRLKYKRSNKKTA